jgi:small subunit ribosomal protein S9
MPPSNPPQWSFNATPATQLRELIRHFKMANPRNVTRKTGRRKTAVASVRLQPGSGAMTINDRSLEVYFPRDTSRMRILEPFELTETNGQYDTIVKVSGGGTSAQADAVRLGISRALVEIAEALRPALRKNGMLTRDPREVERKKYGRHKARKRPQYSKR